MGKENNQNTLLNNMFRLNVNLERPNHIAWVNVLTTDDKKIRGFSVLFETPAMFVNFDYIKEGNKHIISRSGIQSNNFEETLSNRIKKAIEAQQEEWNLFL